MEAALLGEFSDVNALDRRGPADAPLGAAPPRDTALELTHHERLLRGEATYTGALGDGSPYDHFIDDQPQAARLGIARMLPPAAATSTEDRERLLRRLEMSARAREESTKIMSIRFAQRDSVKKEMRRGKLAHIQALQDSTQERGERWARKLSRSPFAVDLVAENQRIDEENRVQDQVEKRRQRLMSHRNREAHNLIFKRAIAESDELDVLRKEKRMLLENEKKLKALRDVERSNARTAEILQDRRRNQVEKQQMRLQQGGFPRLQEARGYPDDERRF